jgi:hypothetical protein
MKRILFSFLVLFCIAGIAMAQESVEGTISATSSDCSTVYSCVSLTIPKNTSSVAAYVNGTYSGTLIFEYSNGSEFTTVDAAVTGTTATGMFRVGVSGMTVFRVRATAYTSGIARIRINSGGGAYSSSTLTSTSANQIMVANTGFLATNTTASPVNVAATDGAIAVLGNKTDNLSTATDTTAASMISLLKEISYQVQHRKGFCDIVGGTTFQYQGTLTDTSYAIVQTTSASNYVYVTVDKVVNHSTTVATKVAFYDWDGAASYTLIRQAGVGTNDGGWAYGNGDGRLFKVPTAGHALVVKAITTGADVDINITGCTALVNY